MNFREQKLAKLAAKRAAQRTPPVAATPPPQPPPPVAAAPVPAADIAALRAEIAAYRDGPPAPPAFPGPHECIDAKAFLPSPSRSIHNAAIAVLSKSPTMSYREAVEIVSRKA